MTDIVFGSGAFAPRTRDGRRIIAHELAHVIQQRAGHGAAPPLDPAAAHERAADAAADAILRGARGVDAGPSTGVGVARIGPEAAARIDADVPHLRVLHGELTTWMSAQAGKKGYETYAVAMLVDADNKEVARARGLYGTAGKAHAEPLALAQLKPAAMKLKGTGARVIVLVDKMPCTDCSGAFNAFIAETEAGVHAHELVAPGQVAGEVVGVEEQGARRPSESGTSTVFTEETFIRPPPAKGGAAKPGSSLPAAEAIETPGAVIKKLAYNIGAGILLGVGTELFKQKVDRDMAGLKNKPLDKTRASGARRSCGRPASNPALKTIDAVHKSILDVRQTLDSQRDAAMTKLALGILGSAGRKTAAKRGEALGDLADGLDTYQRQLEHDLTTNLDEFIELTEAEGQLVVKAARKLKNLPEIMLHEIPVIGARPFGPDDAGKLDSTIANLESIGDTFAKARELQAIVKKKIAECKAIDTKLTAQRAVELKATLKEQAGKPKPPAAMPIDPDLAATGYSRRRPAARRRRSGSRRARPDRGAARTSCRRSSRSPTARPRPSARRRSPRSASRR